MGEIEQLKKRIDDSGPEGITTAAIRDDYEPIGEEMMMHLLATGDYKQRRDPDWKIFRTDIAPY